MQNRSKLLSTSASLAVRVVGKLFQINPGLLNIKQLMVLGILVLSVSLPSSAQTNDNTPVTLAKAVQFSDRGVQLAKDGRFAEAVGQFEEALRLRPDFGDAYSGLGSAFYQLGDRENAAKAFAKAVHMNSMRPDDYNNLGVVYGEIGRNDEALALFERALRLAPDLAVLHYNLGCLLNRMGKYPEAMPYLEKAIILEAGNPMYHRQLAISLVQRKRFSDAAAQLECAVAIDPADERSRLFLGQVYLRRRDKTSAIDQYRALTAMGSSLATRLYTAIYKDVVVFVSEK